MLNLFDIKIHINFLKIKFVEINNFNYYITEPLVKIFFKASENICIYQKNGYS